MEALKKEYLEAKLNLVLEIISQHFSAYKLQLDDNIAFATKLLCAHGFKTTLSCEGHIPPYSKVDTFRMFWPYIEIELIHNIVVHHEEEKPRMETVSGDKFANLQKLKELVMEFNLMKHPFSEKHLEMEVVLVEDSLDVALALQKHWGIKVMICDVGVQGILTMPQELLTDDFRNKFLTRTQHHMELFTKFLEWRYLNPNHNENV